MTRCHRKLMINSLMADKDIGSVLIGLVVVVCCIKLSGTYSYEVAS